MEKYFQVLGNKIILRIGIPVFFTPGEGGGIEIYACNIISQLQKIDRKNEYFLFCSTLNESIFPIVNKNFKKVLMWWPGKKNESMVIVRTGLSRALLTFTEKVYKRISTTMEENKYLKNIKNYIKWIYDFSISTESLKSSEYNMLHFMFTIIPPPWIEKDHNVPIILTVHDIQQEYFPEFFSNEVLDFRRRFYRASVEKANHIIAISNYTKKTLIEKYAVPEDKISVIHNGYNNNIFKKLSGRVIEEIQKKYDLPRSFLFYPAASWPHKNHIILLRAYKILKMKYNFKDKLIFTGIRKENHEAIEKEIDRLSLTNSVIHLGYLPYQDLPALYNIARLMVYPSLFEGFGMPIIEAMATGLPVTCSNTTSLPEIAGDAALFFDPNDPDDIAKIVIRLYYNKELRSTLIRKGLERAKFFTWENTAAKTLKVYENVYKNFYG